MLSPTFNPDPNVIFSLVPMNDAATQVVQSPLNNHLFKNKQDRSAISIAFDPHRTAGLVPCVVGQAGDIMVNRVGIANFHCSFQIHKETGEILLIDYSPSHNVHFHGTNVRNYVNEVHPDAVVIDLTVNTFFSFGGKSGSWYQWYINWHKRPPIDVEAWTRAWAGLRIGQTGTVRDLPPPQRLENGKAEDRFLYRGTLAKHRGMTVNKAVDVYSGQYVAVKRVILDDTYRDIFLEEAREDLTEFYHPHIIEFLQVEIRKGYFNLVMDLQDDTVHKLALEDETFVHTPFPFLRGDKVGRPLLHQMLSALDYLASKNMVHRDVKPHNILYRRINGALHYRLADFGLSAPSGCWFVETGTFPFQAPEVMFYDEPRRQVHTPKIDVWSLCATLIWAFDLKMFTSNHKLRDYVFEVDSSEDVEREVQGTAQRYGVEFAAMAEPGIKHRKSAAELLQSMFDGVGRTT